MNPTHAIRARRYWYGPKETISYFAKGTLEECKKRLRFYEDRIYYLENGESGRPTFKIVRLDSLGPHARRNAEDAWTVPQLEWVNF